MVLSDSYEHLFSSASEKKCMLILLYFCSNVFGQSIDHFRLIHLPEKKYFVAANLVTIFADLKGIFLRYRFAFNSELLTGLTFPELSKVLKEGFYCK